MDSEIITISLAVSIIVIAIFFLVPNALQNLSFSGKLFFKGEIWRIITFNFVHLDIVHLIGNVIALTIITLLALEIGLKGEYFLLLFFISSMAIALIEGIFFPALIIAGASLGIYSVLGGISISGRRIIPIYVFIPLIALSIFLNQVFLDSLVLLQSVFHFFGFLSGIVLYYSIIKYVGRRKILFEVE